MLNALLQLIIQFIQCSHTFNIDLRKCKNTLDIKLALILPFLNNLLLMQKLTFSRLFQIKIVINCHLKNNNQLSLTNIKNVCIFVTIKKDLYRYI